MAEADSAKDRLEQAVLRIEQATKSLNEREATLSRLSEERKKLVRDLNAARDEISKLRNDNLRMERALDETTAKRNAAQAAAAKVSDRLDGAIDQLKLVLEH